MSERPWTLSGRITRWLASITVGLVVVSIGLAAWFVRGAIEREIDGLVAEELEEMSVWLSFSPDLDLAELERYTQELQAEHPSNPMSWRIARRGELVGDFGAAQVREPAPEGERSVRTGTRTTSSGYELDLAIDMSPQLAYLDRFRATAMVLVVFVGLVALAAGILLRRLVVGQLRAIVRRIRERDDLLADTIDSRGFPEEIRSVAEAFGELLQRIRGEAERAELLTAGTAHELRSPIQNLLGETELSLMRERSAEEYREVLRSQHEELRRLVRAVDNLVTLCSTRQRAGAAPRERFDLGQEAELRLRPEDARAAARDVELALHTSGDVSFEGDREALVLVVRNLVGNAVEWAPPGTRVEVRLEGGADELRLVVDDEGPGVPPAERERIFEPFHRGATREGSRAGYGLGLALTRTAVEAHGGRVWVEAAPGGGARFVVVLPRRADPAPSAARGAAPDRARAPA